MKNILARGGIEFIAVLFGISGSLYIDDLQNQNEMKVQISKSMHALIGELSANSQQLSKLEDKLIKDLPELDKLIKKDSIEYWTPVDLDMRIFKAFTNLKWDTFAWVNANSSVTISKPRLLPASERTRAISCFLRCYPG